MTTAIEAKIRRMNRFGNLSPSLAVPGDLIVLRRRSDYIVGCVTAVEVAGNSTEANFGGKGVRRVGGCDRAIVASQWLKKGWRSLIGSRHGSLVAARKAVFGALSERGKKRALTNGTGRPVKLEKPAARASAE